MSPPLIVIPRRRGSGGGGPPPPSLPNLQLREHKRYGSFTVQYTFAMVSSALQMTSPNANLGMGHIYFSVSDKSVLSDRKIEFDWAHTGYTGGRRLLRLRAGSYDRTSSVHFPTNADIAALGTGGITLANIAPAARATNQYSITAANISGLSTADATIILTSEDAWNSEFQTVDVFNIRLMESDGTTLVWDFNVGARSVAMEVTGTEADYGLCAA